MEQKSIFSVISPIMVGPSSSHTAGAVRLGLMARNIYKNEFKKVKFVLYNSFAKTGFGHGTDKGLLAGVLGYSVDITFDDKMTVSGDSVGAGEIRINNINGFSANIDGSYDTLLLMYKDVPGMISQVSDIIQKQKVNIASLHCDRSSKGGTASMYVALDIPIGEDVVNQVKQIKDVFFVTNIRKLK